MKKLLLLVTLMLFSLSCFSQSPSKHKNGVIIGSFTSDPTGVEAGQIYWNDVSKTFRQYNGTTWSDLGSAGGTINIEDEGVLIVTAATLLNFVGSAVTVTDAGGGEATITIVDETGTDDQTIFEIDASGHTPTNYSAVGGVMLYNHILGIDASLGANANNITALGANVLQFGNTNPFTPTLDYEPATKKYVDDASFISGGSIQSKTGTNIVFTENAIYNEANYLTLSDGDLTLNLTGAVDYSTSMVYVDRYTPDINGDYLISGVIDPDKLNILYCFYDGVTTQISVTHKSYIVTPTSAVLTPSIGEVLIENYDVPNSTSYEIYFNEQENEYIDTATMFADQGNQTTGNVQLVTGGIYYEYLGTTNGNASDYLVVSEIERGSATTVPSYNGTDITYNHTGLDSGKIYLYWIKAKGKGYLDSNNYFVSTSPSVASGFVFNVNPANAGVSTTTQFQLPLVSSGTYNFTIYVDDVATDNITTWNQAETLIEFGDSSPHKVELRGIITGWTFNDTGDKLKILDIENWGNLKLGIGNSTLTGFFRGCSNLTVSATDILDLNTTTMALAFLNCDALTVIPSMHLWDYTGIVSFQAWFQDSAIAQPNASAIPYNTGPTVISAYQNDDGFNDQMLNQDMQGITSCSNMFRLSALANPRVDTWINFAPTNIDFMLSTTAFTSKSLANWDISNLTSGANFLLGETMNTADYDATLISWAAQSFQSNVTIHFGSSTYTLGGAAEAARNTLVAAGWIITDGGGI